MGEKLQGLQEEKHQLFLQLKKVLHEEEKRRRKEQRYSGDHSAPPLWHQHSISFVVSSDITTLTSASYASSLPMHAGQHLLSIQGTFLAHLPLAVFDRCKREPCHSLSQAAQ